MYVVVPSIVSPTGLLQLDFGWQCCWCNEAQGVVHLTVYRQHPSPGIRFFLHHHLELGWVQLHTPWSPSALSARSLSLSGSNSSQSFAWLSTSMVCSTVLLLDVHFVCCCFRPWQLPSPLRASSSNSQLYKKFSSLLPLLMKSGHCCPHLFPSVQNWH